MGGFYGSIHFRADNRDSVMPLLEDAAKASGRRFLCGPPLNSWVTAYPDHKGQDERDASVLAARWAGELLYLAVHDDDILIYRYFRGGALVDAYWSAPGYFGEEDRQAQEAQAGAPETYAHLLKGRVEQARSLLERSESNAPTLEIERLVAFAKLLGIANGATSYEYLEGGERSGIRGWKQFAHVPDRSAERSAAAEARARMLQQFAQWKAEGLLLATKEIPSNRQRMPDRHVSIKIGSREVSIDLDERFEILHPADSRRVIARGDRVVLQSDSGETGLLAGTKEIMAARATDRTRELFMLAPLLIQRPPGQALSALLRRVPADRRTIVEEHLRRVLPPPPWDKSQAMHLAQLVSMGANQSDGVSRLALSADGRWLICGTHRGLRVAAWDDVVRTPNAEPVPWKYAYDIPPRDLVANPSHGFVYAVAHDARNGLVLFSGKDGRVRTMSLANGRVENLVDVYDRAPVLRMTLREDGILAIHTQPGFPSVSAKGLKGIVYLWSYEAVLKHAASGACPVDPSLAAHALVPLEPDDLPSPVDQVLQALRTSHERSPKEMRLEALTSTDWPTAEDQARLMTPLVEVGFEPGGRFIVRELQDLLVQFFAQVSTQIVARLTRFQGQETTLTFASVRNDGSSFSVSNRPDLRLERPAQHETRFFEGADVGTLLKLFTRARPKGEWVVPVLGELPERYAWTYREAWAWRDEHGFSEHEAAGFLMAKGRAKRGT